jgi:cytochrome c-type protein NapC
MQIGWLARFWATLRKPHVKYSLLTVGSFFFIGGIVFWGGFNTGLEATNTMSFCTSCHEMRDNSSVRLKRE